MKKLFRILLSVVSILLIVHAYAIWRFSDVIINPPHMTFARYEADNPGTRHNPGELGMVYNKGEIVVNTRGDKCFYWFVPGESDKLVVISHGRGSNRLEMLDHVSFLHRAGYNCLLVDLHRNGESYSAPCSFGYWESRELVLAISDVVQQYGMNEVILYGFSMGGAAVVMAAPYIDNLRAVILDSSYVSFRSIVTEQAGRDYRPFLYVLGKVFWLTEKRLGFDINLVDLAAGLRALDVPVMLIHGDADKTVDCSNSLLLYGRANAPKELWITHAGHIGSHAMYGAEYENRVQGFLENAD